MGLSGSDEAFLRGHFEKRLGREMFGDEWMNVGLYGTEGPLLQW